MPKIFYCLKCSTAKYEHYRDCRSRTTKTYYFNRLGASCEPSDPEAKKTIYRQHRLVDLQRKPYCCWKRDYIKLRRVYIRLYNPAGWKAVGWICGKCGVFIKS